jgi:hypothetical protein
MFRKKLQLNDSLDTLKILLFWRIMQEKTPFLLDINYKEGKKYNDVEVKIIEETWLSLYDKYWILRDNKQSQSSLDKGIKELELIKKIKSVDEVLNALIHLHNNKSIISEDVFMKVEQEYYSTLKIIDKRIKPKLFEGVGVNINNIQRVLNSLQNTYNQEFKKPETKTIKKEINNVFEVVANTESWLDRSLFIDTIVVSQWIAYEKQVETKQKAQQDVR